MTIYVVHGGSYLCGASYTTEGAEEAMAKQIERVRENTRRAELQHNRCFLVQVTAYKVDTEPTSLTLSETIEELILALRGVTSVTIEVAGTKEKYRIQEIDLAG